MPVSKLRLVINQTDQLYSTGCSNIQFYHATTSKLWLTWSSNLKELCPFSPWCHFVRSWTPFFSAPPCSNLWITPTLSRRSTLLEKWPQTGALTSWPISSMVTTLMSQQRLNPNFEQYLTKNSDIREGKCNPGLDLVTFRVHSPELSSRTLISSLPVSPSHHHQ